MLALGIVKDIAHTELNSDVVALNTEDRVSTARLEVDRLLKRPLTEAAAVQIALLNNRGLQAAYNALGISEAEKVRATLPPNPRFSASYIAGGGGLEALRKVAGRLNFRCRCSTSARPNGVQLKQLIWKRSIV